jgi:hypothetical protein
MNYTMPLYVNKYMLINTHICMYIHMCLTYTFIMKNIENQVNIDFNGEET